MSEPDETTEPEESSGLTAKETFHVRNPATGQYEVFAAGDDVPVEVAQSVSPDLIDGDVPEGEAADPDELLAKTRGEFDREIRAAVDKALAARDAEEAADAYADEDEDADGTGGEFDPAQHDAKAVYDYLSELPDDEDGQAEWDRVTGLEVNGQNRKTAIPK